MKKLIILLSLVLSSLASELEIIAFEIPGLHEKDGRGHYDKLINEIVVDAGLGHLNLYPAVRAKKMFASGCTNCCLSAVNKNPDFYDYTNGYVETLPMSTVKVYIFTAQGTKSLKSLDELKNKVIGVRRGIPYGKRFEQAKLNLSRVDSIKQNILKLDKGRIDAFIAYVPDAYYIFEELEREPYPHDINNPIAVHNDSLVCRGVSQGFIDTFNKALQKHKSKCNFSSLTIKNK